MGRRRGTPGRALAQVLAFHGQQTACFTYDDRAALDVSAAALASSLDALARSEDAVDAYRAALALYPRAQSAGLGLAIALMRLDRTTEADETARSLRDGGAMTPDPWLHYPRGDDRFAGRWIDSLRATVR